MTPTGQLLLAALLLPGVGLGTVRIRPAEGAMPGVVAVQVATGPTAPAGRASGVLPGPRVVSTGELAGWHDRPVLGASVEDLERDGTLAYLLGGQAGVLAALGTRDGEVRIVRRLKIESPLYLPQAIISLGAKRVAILDAAGPAVKVFELGGSVSKLTHSFVVIQNPIGMCTLDGIVYVTGLSSGHLVHSYSASDGRLLLDFGAPFGAQDELFDDMAARGHITCLAGPRLIVISSDVLGQVRAYRTDGVLAWSHVLGPYARINTVSDGTTITTRIPEGGFDFTVGMFALNRDTLAVQIGHVARPRADPDAVARVRTTLLGAKDGNDAGNLDLSNRIRFQGRGFLFFVEPDSARAIRLLKWRQGETR